MGLIDDFFPVYCVVSTRGMTEHILYNLRVVHRFTRYQCGHHFLDAVHHVGKICALKGVEYNCVPYSNIQLHQAKENTQIASL